LLSDKKLGIPTNSSKIVVDFSSPNIAKEMHVGHLRSTILGDCLANGLEELGNTVFRINQIGDWGTQFGMLIFYLKCVFPELYHGDNRRLEKITLVKLTKYYKEANENFLNCFFFKKKSREEVVLLQKEDVVSTLIWKIICVISKESYDNIYNLLNIKLYDKGESFYGYYIPLILTILEERKLTFISKKATCVKVCLDTKVDFITIVKKADGGYNYMMTELAA
jgi:arginyl-tRNA synthetase